MTTIKQTLTAVLAKNTTRRWLSIYILLTILGYLLFPTVWGLVIGTYWGVKFASDPFMINEIEKLVGDNPIQGYRDFHKLPEEQRTRFEKILREELRSINWFPLHFTANLITFGILGLLAGWLLRDHILAGIIPLSLLLGTLGILMHEDFSSGYPELTILFGISIQFISVYLSAYWGVQLKERRLLVKNSVKKS
jgi:hypothetical protein